jgi:ferredoxin
MPDRLRLDPIRCDGYGLCAEVLPELIRLDEWGFPIVTGDPIPANLARQAARATDSCPVLALRLVRLSEPAVAREAPRSRNGPG